MRDNAAAVTSYLKGLAIAAVMINHYINDFLPGELGGYASGFIAVFFVLSGYGIFHSLEKNASSCPAARHWAFFFAGRALRLYPLYWASLALSSILLHTSYSPATVMGSPFSKAAGIYWFISAIIQCYLVAPFIYSLLKRHGIRKYIAAVSITILSLYLLQTAVDIKYPPALVYRSFPFTHILLFAIGLSMPQLISRYRNSLASNIGLVISCAAFIALVHFTRHAFIGGHHNFRVLLPLFIVACSFFA